MLSTRTGHVLHVQRQRGANLRKLTRERRASNPATTQVSLLGARIQRAQRRAMLSVTCDGEAPHKTTGTGCFEPIGLPGRHCDAPHANTARGPPERRTGRRATSLPLVPSTPGALTRQPCRKAAAVAWFACLRVRRPRDLARDVVFVPPSSHPLPSFRRCLPACPFVVPPASSSPLSFCAGLVRPFFFTSTRGPREFGSPCTFRSEEICRPETASGAIKTLPFSRKNNKKKKAGSQRGADACVPARA